MRTDRDILLYLNNLDDYLSNYHTNYHSTHFEHLVVEACSSIFHLPFYDKDTNNDTEPYRVIWYGKTDPIERAGYGPDAIAYCYDYYLIIEATMKTGTRQWRQEFNECVDHCECFCAENNIDTKDVYILMICNELNSLTFRSIQNQEYKIIPIEVSGLIEILETSKIAFTITHYELKRLFNNIDGCLNETTSINNFRELLGFTIEKWKQDVFDSEKSVFIGIKAYEIMQKNRNLANPTLSSGEVFNGLINNDEIKDYIKYINYELDVKKIEDILIQLGFASKVGKIIYNNEIIFEPVPYIDFKKKAKKVIKEMKKNLNV